MSPSGIRSVFDKFGILPTPQRLEIAGILKELINGCVIVRYLINDLMKNIFLIEFFHYRIKKLPYY